MLKKFWTFKDGVLGTAHQNRSGQTVDFRPCALRGISLGNGSIYVIEALADDGTQAELHVHGRVVFGDVWTLSQDGLYETREKKVRANIFGVTLEAVCVNDTRLTAAGRAAEEECTLEAIQREPLKGLSTRLIGRLKRSPSRSSMVLACIVEEWERVHGRLIGRPTGAQIREWVLEADRVYRAERKLRYLQQQR